MSNIFILHYKLQGKFMTLYIQLIPNIYKFKVDKIILPNSNLCMPSKNKMIMFNFPDLILK